MALPLPLAFAEGAAELGFGVVRPFGACRPFEDDDGTMVASAWCRPLTSDERWGWIPVSATGMEFPRLSESELAGETERLEKSRIGGRTVSHAEGAMVEMAMRLNEDVGGAVAAD